MENEEVVVYNKHEPYIPVEYAYIDYERSWKKCRCGQIVKYRDGWCSACGQRLAFPPFKDEEY